MTKNDKPKKYDELYIKFRQDMGEEGNLRLLKERLEVEGEEIVYGDRFDCAVIDGAIDIDFEGSVNINGTECEFNDSASLDAADYDLHVNTVELSTHYEDVVSWFKQGLEAIANAQEYSTAGLPPKELSSGSILYAICRQMAEDLAIEDSFLWAGACEAVYHGSSFLAPTEEGGEE
tara:strand:- start:11334 stop:11861 length:528 start_codon:yes stop_codon:yes gene_type:complete